MYEGNDHPSDIDMFYMCKDNTLIIGEIKNSRGHFGDGQRDIQQKRTPMAIPQKTDNSKRSIKLL